jgi:DeoR/GlpR family transcriptional regulator of sugar metabolism
VKTKSEIYQRYKKILQFLIEKPELSTDEIRNILGGPEKVTDKIIWQDIKALNEMGLVEKIRGGIKSNITAGKNTEFFRHFGENKAAKKAIARLAIKKFLLHNHPDSKICIYLDSGSTNLTLFKEIVKDESLRHISFKIVSNNVSLTHECCSENVTLILSGGLYSYQDECLLDKAVEIFSSYPAKYAFLSASNLSYSGGFLGYNPGEKKVKEAMIQNAEELCILADNTKFRFTGGERIARFNWSSDEKILKLFSEENKILKTVKIITDSSESNSDILKNFSDSENGVFEKDVEKSIFFAEGDS